MSPSNKNNNKENSADPENTNFPSKNFSQSYEPQEVKNTETKTSDPSSKQHANTGNWEDQRDSTELDKDYDSGKNDNTGGAGSTGSAATNS